MCTTCGLRVSDIVLRVSWWKSVQQWSNWSVRMPSSASLFSPTKLKSKNCRKRLVVILLTIYLDVCTKKCLVHAVIWFTLCMKLRCITVGLAVGGGSVGLGLKEWRVVWLDGQIQEGCWSSPGRVHSHQTESRNTGERKIKLVANWCWYIFKHACRTWVLYFLSGDWAAGQAWVHSWRAGCSGWEIQDRSTECQRGAWTGRELIQRTSESN